MSDSTGWGTSIRRDAAGNVISEERLRNSFDGGGWSTRGNWAGAVGEGRTGDRRL